MMLLISSLMLFAQAEELSLMPINFSEKSSTVQIVGRVIPGMGAMSVETSELRGTVGKVLVRPGETIVAGRPLVQLAGSDCKGRDKCEIKATRAGTVNEITVAAGNEVNPGDSLLTLLKPSELSVRLDVPDKFVKYIHVGKDVTVHFKDLDKRAINTHVAEMLPTIGGAETTRGVRLARMTLPKDVRLDSVVSAEFHVPLKGDGAKVPSRAVVFANGQQFVVRALGKELAAVPVEVLSEQADSLWIIPRPGAKIESGDSILANNAIFYLTQILEEHRE